MGRPFFLHPNVPEGVQKTESRYITAHLDCRKRLDTDSLLAAGRRALYMPVASRMF